MRYLLAGIASTIAAVCMTVAVSALAIPPAPSLDRPIIDQTGTLSEQQIDTLSSQIQTSRTKKDYQIGVLMIPTLENEALEDYSIKVARAWGVGEKDKNNGILLLIAKDDHKLRIEVGSGLEGDLTDIQSGHIIDDVITPKFREGDFYGGIHDGLESIAALVQGEADPHPYTMSMGSFIEGALFFIFLGIMVLSWFISILARTKSWWAGGVFGAIGGLLICFGAGFTIMTVLTLLAMTLAGVGLDWLVSRNYHERKSRGLEPSWWAGGGTFGGGSSGGGFGGGGFSGGGASGSW